MTRGRGPVRSDARHAPVPVPPELEVLERSPEVCIAADGCVLFQLWRQTSSLESFLRFEALMEQFSAAHTRYATLSVVEAGVGAPDTEVRQAAARVVERFEAQAVGNALVIEGNGFRQTGMRLVITTIQLISPPKTPAPVFSRVDTASNWLAAQMPELSATRLVRDMAAMRGL